MRNFRRRPGGLTKKTTEVQDEEFLAIARNNPLWSSAKILHATDIPVSTKTKTVRRRLKQAGLTCYKAAKVVQFTEEHAQMRREFALQNLNENWEMQLVFLTVAIAAGLYYLAELVEEYTVFTRKCIWWTNLVILILYLCLWLFEKFPILMIFCGILAQILHFIVLQDFPFVTLTSPAFILSLILITVKTRKR
ncbi:Transposase [Popillia japonica]|uniref:Protein TEX261 n=1 Tax=Popillia japonica TaxID=7064 RepID=A0AAW1JFC5_POPJA